MGEVLSVEETPKTGLDLLEKVGLDSGIRKFEKLAFDKIQLPENHTLRPNIGNIKIANQTRGILND